MAYPAQHLDDTIVALATPPGLGAIGVVRLSGKKAIAIVDKVFKGKNLQEQPSHTIHLGTIRDEQDRLIDEVLVSLFIAPRSYTGENVVEVSCHGSAYIEQELIRLFIRQGARLARPGEFTLRAFLNGKMDLSQAEAVADLIASDSAAAHDIAFQQMRGGFSSEIQKLRQELIDFASLIELELDFAEEDVEFANREELKQLVVKIRSILQSLIHSFQLGNVVKNGVATVIAGRPNAGKSTLLNALLNEERAIVSEVPGTTRDTIEEVLNINGIQFRLIDTAGIRDAQDQIEAIGVQKTLEKIQQSALLLYVFDASQLKAEELQADLAKLPADQVHTLVIANKMDRNPYATAGEFGFHPDPAEQESDAEPNVPSSQQSHATTPQNSSIAPGPHSDRPTTQQPNIPSTQPPTLLRTSNFIPISALNRMNIPYLKERLYQAVVGQKVKLDGTIVTNARHYEALQGAYDSLADALRAMNEGISSDFVAMDIRRALHHLGEITGEISTDDLLGNIFGKFCIGK